jgi:hypothetical protein
LRLQPPLRYIRFPKLEDYLVIITANIHTYRMTRREHAGESRHAAIQSNLASPPLTHFCSFAYLQWASTVQFQLSGLVTLMASWGKKILLWISHILSVHQATVRFYKARRLIQVDTRACLFSLSRSPLLSYILQYNSDSYCHGVWRRAVWWICSNVAENSANIVFKFEEYLVTSVHSRKGTEVCVKYCSTRDVGYTKSVLTSGGWMKSFSSTINL